MNAKAQQFLRSLVSAPRSVLLLDYDGTLAPFALERHEAVPYAGLTELLQQIMKTGRTRLLIVTGRDGYEIAPLLKLDPLPEVWGSHGLQRLWPDGRCEMPEIPAKVSQALEEGRRWLLDQGIADLVELKPGSIAAHWRGIDDEAASKLRGRVLLGWFPIAERGSLRLLEFDGGVEMRMADMDKGDAVRVVLSETAREVPVAYLGDDATDEHAFQALGDRGLTVLVRPVERRTAAQVWLQPPEELQEFLEGWLEATSGAPRPTIPYSTVNENAEL